MHSADLLLELVPSEDGVGGTYRTVSGRVFAGRLRVPARQASITETWRAQIAPRLKEPGDIDALASMGGRPADEALVSSMFAWLEKQGLPDLSDTADVNVLGCTATHFHHDISGFADCLFCIVWLEAAQGLDLVFPDLKKRIPLQKGTVVVFDAAQPHGVLRAGHAEFDLTRYVDLPAQIFLSMDFKADLPAIVGPMGIRLMETAEGWPGVIVPITSDGPQMEPVTGKWRTPLKKTPAPKAA